VVRSAKDVIRRAIGLPRIGKAQAADLLAGTPLADLLQAMYPRDDITPTLARYLISRLTRGLVVPDQLGPVAVAWSTGDLRLPGTPREMIDALPALATEATAALKANAAAFDLVRLRLDPPDDAIREAWASWLSWSRDAVVAGGGAAEIFARCAAPVMAVAMVAREAGVPGLPGALEALREKMFDELAIDGRLSAPVPTMDPDTIGGLAGMTADEAVAEIARRRAKNLAEMRRTYEGLGMAIEADPITRLHEGRLAEKGSAEWR